MNIEIATNNEPYLMDLVGKGLSKSNAQAYHSRNISDLRRRVLNVQSASQKKESTAFAQHCQCRIALESSLLGYLVGYVYRTFDVFWLHDGVWVDAAVCSADIAWPNKKQLRKSSLTVLIQKDFFAPVCLATEHSKAVELFSNIPTVSYIFPAHPVHRRHHAHNEVYHARMRKRTRRF